MALKEAMPPVHAAKMTSLHDKVLYTAPELLGSLWKRLYDTVVEEAAVDEPWVEHARAIWNQACASRPT